MNLNDFKQPLTELIALLSNLSVSQKVRIVHNEVYLIVVSYSDVSTSLS